MSRPESAFCRSAPWHAFARRVVLPWALQGFEPTGRVLEIGAGDGAMAGELLASRPGITMTVTDVDEQMMSAASHRLAVFGDRASAQPADATALPFPDRSFDVVLSWIMLHHTLEWEKALAEATRVLRPGGHLVGYDLLATYPMRVLHQAEGSRVRMLRLDELRHELDTLPVDRAVLTVGLGGLVVRFLIRRAG